MKMYVVVQKDDNTFVNIKSVFQPSEKNFSLLNRLSAFLKGNQFLLKDFNFYEIEYTKNQDVISSKKIDDEIIKKLAMLL